MSADRAKLVHVTIYTLSFGSCNVIRVILAATHFVEDLHPLLPNHPLVSKPLDKQFLALYVWFLHLVAAWKIFRLLPDNWFLLVQQSLICSFQLSKQNSLVFYFSWQFGSSLDGPKPISPYKAIGFEDSCNSCLEL